MRIKTENRSERKTGKCTEGIGMALIAIQVIVATILAVKLFKMDVLPVGYLVTYGIAIVLINVGVYFAFRKKIPAIIMAIISVIITCGLVYALIAVVKLDNTLQKVSADKRLEVVKMSVIVLKDEKAEKLSDIAGTNVGYVTDDKGTQDIKDIIDGEVKKSVNYTAYNNVLFLADALLNGTERAIIMNSAYIDVISEQDNYEDFSNKVRELYTFEVEVQVEEDNAVPEQEVQQEEPYKLSSDENTFVMYISGIDTFGSVNVKSRSDVNILAIVNTQTGHIQLINTPRDYYVMLPEKGAMDKLTHAGLYGVESSESAIENLYGIKIDYYLRMNFSGFEEIIDTLGGIDVYSEYDFAVEPVKHYTTGYNHLSGIEALAFARERHAFAAGDIQRGNNQMEVIKAMINKMTSTDMLTNYSKVLKEISDCFQTDMPAEVAYDLVKYQLTNGISWRVDSYSVTGSGEHKTTYSMPNATCYVMEPNDSDVEQAKQLIENVLSEK